MPRFATLFIALVLLAPATARAKFQLRIERDAGFDENNRLTLDVWASPTDDEDEQLVAYDIGFFLESINPSPQRVLSFAPPYATRPAEGFVFGDDPATFVVPTNVSPGPGPGWFLINVGAGPGTALRDITGPVKLATLHVAIDPGWGLGQGYRYRVRFDERSTAFGSGDPTRLDPTIEYTIATDPDSGLIERTPIIPEPSAAGLVLAAGALALRRRRVG